MKDSPFSLYRRIFRRPARSQAALRLQMLRLSCERYLYWPE
jgi:hypothetical protein